MGGIIFTLVVFLKSTLDVNDLITLISTVIVGVVSYASLLFILDRTLCREIFQLLFQLRPLPREIAWQGNCGFPI